jgi:hypothetical protein
MCRERDLLVYGWHDAHLAALYVFVTCDSETSESEEWEVLVIVTARM